LTWVILMYFPIYYQYRERWSVLDYSEMNRCIQKLVDYYGRVDTERLKELDLRHMSNIAQCMLFCIIKTQKKDYLFEMENLSSLKKLKPLSVKIQISERPLGTFEWYNEMNFIR